MQYSQVEMIETDDISASRRPSGSSLSSVSRTGGVVGGALLGLAFIGLSLGGALPGLPWAWVEPDSSDTCWPIVADTAPRSLGQGLRLLATGEEAEDMPAAKRQKPSGTRDLCKIRVPRKDWPDTLSQLVASSSWTQHLTYELQQDGSELTTRERNYFIGAGFLPHHIPLTHIISISVLCSYQA